MQNTLESGLDATRLAGRLTGNQPWVAENNSYPLDNGLEAAVAQGLKVVAAQPNQLLIDIDNIESYSRYHAMIGMLASFFEVYVTSDLPSKSGADHRHITLTLGNSISNVERVLLQAVLGSDPKRELLSYIRLLRGIEPATLFFEEPEAGVTPKKEICDLSIDDCCGNGGRF